jgi:hypothetical protein
MMDRAHLVAGHLYWVIPVHDVDFIPPGFEGQEWSDALFNASWSHWSNKVQPALFEGYGPDGDEHWIYLGQERDESNWWPVCWIGDDLVPPHSPQKS